MFSYFGSKSKIIDLYPPPKNGLIIEPFAGSARYALKYADRDVILCDKYDVVTDIWLWLQVCSPQDILALPRLSTGEKISECKEAENLPQAAKHFLGFVYARGNAYPCNKVSKFADWERGGNPNFFKNVADKIQYIKHWQIINGSYEELENQPATWFIDPPYQTAGIHYRYGSEHINYNELAGWCKSRLGQVIVCENQYAKWLPFERLKKTNNFLNLKKRSVPAEEWIWQNNNARSSSQLDLFLR